MENVIATTKANNFIIAGRQPVVVENGIITRFLQWCESQEERRFVWLAVALFVQIGLALPCTLASIVFFGGNNFGLWILACVVNVPVLALNLAAQPTKTTLPVMTLALIADVAIILGAVTSYLLA